MTSSNNATKTQDSLTFDELLGAIAESKLELPEKISPPVWSVAFGRILDEIRRLGAPRALVNAIHYFGGGDLILQIAAEPRRWKRTMLEFLQANREFFERVYISGRFLPPFSDSFDAVSSAFQNLFLALLRRHMQVVGLRYDPTELVALHNGRTDVVVMLLPVTKNEHHLIAITVRQRRWYIPPSKADENFREFRRCVEKALRQIRPAERGKIRNETYVMIGRYTKKVMGFFRPKGLSRSKQAVLVFDDRRRPWRVYLIRMLRNLFSKRLSRLEERLDGREPFGEVADRIRVLRAYSSFLSANDLLRRVLV